MNPAADFRRSPVTIVAGAAAILATAAPAFGALLEDVRPLPHGEIWRPFTGHIAHASVLHLALNLALFLPLAWLRERAVGSRRFACELVLVAVVTSAGVRFLHDDWTTYRGLSGVVYGLIALQLLPSERSRFADFGVLIVAALALKSAWELAIGGWIVGADSLSSDLGVRFLPGSHCAGLAAGSLLWWLARWSTACVNEARSGEGIAGLRSES